MDNLAIRRSVLIIIVAAAVSLAGLGTWFGRGDAQPAPGPARVVGSLVLHAMDAKETPLDINLPDRVVTLRDGSGDVAKATTLLNGAFELIAPHPGVYQVCWTIGGEQGCGNRVVVGRSTASSGPVRAAVKRPFVFGIARTGDDRPCWANDSFFGLNFATVVTGGGATTRANTQGQFALIGPAPGIFRLTARCQTTTAGANVTLAGAALRTDISLGNHAPLLTGLSAVATAKGVTRVAPGSSVKLVSGLHPAANPVQFSWKAGAASGVLTGGNGPTQAWALPSTPGLHSAYLMAQDGKGGLAYKRIDLQVGTLDIDLSGRVIDEATNAPLAGATVTVGTGPLSATTSAAGWFKLRAPPNATDRYVLNIHHPDYALLSRVTDRSAEGDTYPLIRAQITTSPSDQPITIVDKDSGGPCGTGGDQAKIRRLVGPSILHGLPPADPKAAAAERSADAVALRQAEASESLKNRCIRRGAELKVPANAFLDASNAPYSGTVRASVTTLDPARRAIPGDYRAKPKAGGDAELLSLGAVHVEFTDPAGHPLHLRPGMTADVSIPAFTVNPATAPATIATWSYDESTGFWREELQATLQTTPQGPAYVGKTTHFSTLNMDVAGLDPVHATCVRFEVDAAFNAWSNLTIRAYVSFNGTEVKVKETPLDNAQYHAIFRIPYHTGFPNTLRLELRGTFSGVNEILLDNIINTELRPKMTGTNLWPLADYTECGDPVLLTPAVGVVPNWGDFDASNRPTFLGGPHGQFNPVDGAAQATLYYAAVDPGSAKTTLGAWWQQNGFGGDGLGAGNPSYVRQAYLNFGDLGFGRDMHCIESGAKRACYVTNYGAPDQNPANADAAETLDATKRGATVTMEFDDTATLNPATSTDERVQFYVFGGGVAASARIQFADLDGFGPKPVPFLCMVCHGGQSSLTAAHKSNYSRFREFDLPSFHYSGGRTWDFGSPLLTAPELANFAKLNQTIHDAPGGTAISELVNQWYPGGLGSGAPTLPTPPAGWSGQVSGYHNVYAKSCRTCHVARDEGDNSAYFLFSNSSDLAARPDVVCGSPPPPRRRVMPNAIVPYKNFWADSTRVQLYETLTTTGAGTCGG